MSYTTNPHLPKVRMDAVKLVRSGWSTRKVAKHTGFNQSTIVRWTMKAPASNHGVIFTRSSRPFHHPNELPEETVRKILEYRRKHRRCAEVLHHLLRKDGHVASLSSVKRTLKRNGLTRYSKWKKWHKYPARPMPEKPGILVQIDTIHIGEPKEKLYVYSLLDVCSRRADAWPTERITTHKSFEFMKSAIERSPFAFRTIQSDHGPEFSKWFTKRIIAMGMTHRHSRIRTPNDNAHLERFNRTIQEECLSRIPRNLRSYRKEIPEYLLYYNNERPHMALDMKTPFEVMRSY